ncbi:beta-lactamase hydrolase domain-containing protein [Nostoc sp. 'Peltigera malacea cyanobiont' DB3992]|uniref:beta-lactamase hydrolase domain-containing protein n=1 Tax=Nostoc sp. 'Peltigera malacea cyanobiont' DB3992 TaxID=1206980 RepID=UPI00267AA513|nr:sulfur transferase domain-containing protein [Nostoc sp. 'Peltigera malacea cyanobiont' DB3992]
MNIVRKINDNLAIAGQITLDQLGQIADEGYKSVLNLRLPDEIGLLANEQEKTELLGLYYVNIPLKTLIIKVCSRYIRSSLNYPNRF